MVQKESSQGELNKTHFYRKEYYVLSALLDCFSQKHLLYCVIYYGVFLEIYLSNWHGMHVS